jgi:DNA-binding MarR family transcriptional regulator
MSDSLIDRAIRLEAALPKLMRVLFSPDQEDPLCDLPIAQLRVMRLIYDQDATVGDLSHDLLLSASAVTQIANRLETAGLIERVEVAEDRRRRVLRLSRHGRELMLRRRDRRVSQAEDMLRQLDRDRQEAVLSAIEELAAVPRSHPREPLVVTAEIENSLPSVPSFADHNL